MLVVAQRKKQVDLRPLIVIHIERKKTSNKFHLAPFLFPNERKTYNVLTFIIFKLQVYSCFIFLLLKSAFG